MAIQTHSLNSKDSYAIIETTFLFRKGYV